MVKNEGVGILKKQAVVLLSLALILSLVLVGCGASQTNNDADFFKGQVVTIIVPHGAGGGYDAYARTIAPYLQKYLGAKAVLVDNVTGAGGLIGRNNVYNAQPDGLTIGFSTFPGMYFAQLAGTDGIKYDVAKFTWLPRVGYEYHVMAVNPTKQLDTLDAFQKAKEVKFGFSGIGSDDYYGALILSKHLKLNIAPITGYQGSNEANLAAMKGEVDGVETTYSSILSPITNKSLTPVLVITDHKPDVDILKNVPMAIDEVKRLNAPEALPIVQALTNTYELDRVFFAPPGMKEGRAKVLRDALDKALQDPELVKALTSTNKPITYANSDEVNKMVKEITSQSEILTKIVKEVTAKK